MSRPSPLVILLSLVVTSSLASAQNGVTPVRARYTTGFNIEPLVHQLVGRSGDVLQFSFTATSRRRDTNIELLPVTLEQRSGGQIDFQFSSAADSMLTFVTPTRMPLSADNPVTIDGLITLPRRDARGSYLFGAIIRDLGVDAGNATEIESDSAASLKFVTQYLVRIEVEVSDVRDGRSRDVKIDNIRIEPFDGRPRLMADLTNPTGSPMRLTAGGSIRSQRSTRRIRPFGLSMPINTNAQGQDRFNILVLPQTTIQIAGLLPSVIGSGDHDARIELSQDGRAISHFEQTLSVRADRFPSQRYLVGELENGIAITPAQIELSRARGGRRRLSLTLENPTDAPADIRMAILPGYDAEPVSPEAGVIDPAIDNAGDILLSPTTVNLPPGRSRTISMTLRSGGSPQPIQTATLMIGGRLRGDTGEYLRKLPIVVVDTDVAKPEVTLSPPRFVATADGLRFEADVTHRSGGHLPLVARLLIRSADQNMELQGGFDRWLLPGRQVTLPFDLTSPLPPGNYELTCQLQVAGQTQSTTRKIQLTQ